MSKPDTTECSKPLKIMYYLQRHTEYLQTWSYATHRVSKIVKSIRSIEFVLSDHDGIKLEIIFLNCNWKSSNHWKLTKTLLNCDQRRNHNGNKTYLNMFLI